MKKKLLTFALAGAAALSMVLSGCAGGGSQKAETQTEEESGGESQEKSVENTEAVIDVPDEVTKGGELNIALVSSPKNLDPVKYTGTYESQIIYQVCDTIVSYDMELKEILPSLATEWTISDDGMVYTFTIRDDVTAER